MGGTSDDTGEPANAAVETALAGAAAAPADGLSTAAAGGNWESALEPEAAVTVVAARGFA